MSGKNVELLTELLPACPASGILRHAIHGAEVYAALEAAASRMNVAIELVEIGKPTRSKRIRRG
jgi:hypothetical protein